MSDHKLDKPIPSVPTSPLHLGGGSHLTPAETIVLKEQYHGMWKFELVHLYAKIVGDACIERDPSKQHRLLQKAELLSDEILVRMKR